MPHRNNVFQQGSCYHIYNRGANREPIFRNDENYRYFLRLLISHIRDVEIGLICYCLMPNHYHLLLHQGGNVTISKALQGMLSAYSQAFNIENHRTGTLFEGRFKHVPVTRPETIT